MKHIRKITAFFTAVTLLSSTAVTAGAAKITCKAGDVNLDGIVDTADAEILRNALWGQETLTAAQRTAADVNGDLHVDFNDLTEVNDIISGAAEAKEISFDADDNGNVLHYLNGNENIEIVSDGWQGAFSNAASGSVTDFSNYYMNLTNSAAELKINPWGVGAKDGTSEIYYSQYGVSSKTDFADGSFSTYRSADGNIYDKNSYLLNNESLVVRRTSEFFANTSENNDVFAPTDYGMNGTVHLVNADITKLENGYEFINNISDYTVYSFLGSDFAVMDDVTFHYADGKFTYEGIDPESIVTECVGERDGYAEIALITDRYVYGLMYEYAYDFMAAFVRYDFETGEAALAQYTPSVDLATVSIHYAQEGVVEYGLEHPELMVKWLDDYYDPDHMVFETVMYRQKMKCVQIGKMNDAYKIYDGLTFTQLPTGVNTVVKNHGSENSTLMFGSGIFNISTNNCGVFNTGNIYQYTAGTESFTVVSLDGSLYSAASPVTYKNTADSTSEAFTVSSLLKQKTATMY